MEYLKAHVPDATDMNLDQLLQRLLQKRQT